MKKFFIIFFLIFIFVECYSQEIITVGISSPFLKNESPVTRFYNKHFAFEILFNYVGESFKFEILTLDKDDIEGNFLKNCKKESINIKSDYLLYSTVQSSESFLFFKVQLINPYSDVVFLSKYYVRKIDYTVNEALSDSVDEIIDLMHSIKIPKVERKFLSKIGNKDDQEEEIFSEVNIRKKHEIFFLNGFFRNHSGIMSFFELCTGYNFAPFDFFSVEGAFFIGAGEVNTLFDINDIGLSKMFLGGYAAFFFFLSGIVEPSVGLKFELNYIHGDHLRFTFPIDFGLKIYINNDNVIRLNSSFQFICFKFDIQTIDEIIINNSVWENNFIVGLSLGYARKI